MVRKWEDVCLTMDSGLRLFAILILQHFVHELRAYLSFLPIPLMSFMKKYIENMISIECTVASQLEI